MDKSIIVVYHVRDQAVWIEDVCIFPYTKEGLTEANERLDKLEKRADYIYADTVILETPAAEEVFKMLDSGNENKVYDYMFKRDMDDLRDINI